jgi:hypothetical protein
VAISLKHPFASRSPANGFNLNHGSGVPHYLNQFQAIASVIVVFTLFYLKATINETFFRLCNPKVDQQTNAYV